MTKKSSSLYGYNHLPLQLTQNYIITKNLNQIQFLNIIIQFLGEFGAWQMGVALLLWLPASLDGVQVKLKNIFIF